ncbi:allantoate amidohydrolase [uncultured Nevskia sp.]|uniref:allantoate amidohydrolase n=1 Tax=uncultured Nevskia sp. TaxID=228950 RepID=UPI0025D06758|nr:allantoate amidohydrolase [uncultured Nevskia sp.]
MIALNELNAASADAFVAALAGIFEHSPWVAEAVLPLRPFSSRLQLHEAMCAAVDAAGIDAQLKLIRAHPELAGRAAVRKELTAESTREQQGAGLDACTPGEFATLQTLNDAYNTKFGFPFVLAVRGHNRSSVIAAFMQRLDHDLDTERKTALQQIDRIAGFRLYDSVSSAAGSEILAMLDCLAQYSDQADGLTCSYLSPAHRQTAALIRDWMLAAGLSVEIDAVGNVVGRLYSEQPNAKTLLTGSHYDTVVDGGKYDGRLGIVLPILVALDLRQRGLKLPYALEIIAFSEEEGVRYKSTFLGSGAVVGQFDPVLLDAVDGNGVTLRAAMLEAGFDPEQIPAIARDPASLLGYVEVHIEQGPVLLDEDQPLGVVTSIAGSHRYTGSITGLAGHSGTVPMHLRHDAAAAAAELILYVERRCSGVPGLVGTVGRLEVPGGAINVIPGRCTFSLDIRAADDLLRDAAVVDVLAEIDAIAERRKVDIVLTQVLAAACAPCATRLQAQWAASIRRVTGNPAPRHLPSGAGHDAMKMAAITDIGMLFVRCGNGGISHNPAETMSADDADVATRVFTDFLLSYPAT